MNRCPISYEPCEGDNKYSQKGLKTLSKQLKSLNAFPYTAKEQVQLAVELASKISIQGVQPKLSVILNVKNEDFEIVEIGGKFILKPPHQLYEEVPQNEDLTMRLAQTVGIKVPIHGMIYNNDQSLSYFIKRFDRIGRHKVAVEDFSQLLEYTRETKYESSMEKIISVIEKQCTFPLLEKVKLFRLTLFNFLVGNEDMHLKNFSIIRQKDKIELSPAYDLLNTTILFSAKEEIALPIRGKKSKISRSDLFEYFAIERLGLSTELIDKEFLNFEKCLPVWEHLVGISFLSEKMRERYWDLVKSRWQRLQRV